MKDIKEYIDKYTKILSLNGSISYSEAEKRSADFLVALAQLVDYKHILFDEKIKLLSIQNATYAQELAKGSGKTMTENKITAEASKEYQKAREDYELIENDIKYLSAYIDIFTAAHIFYRQMARGENA